MVTNGILHVHSTFSLHDSTQTPEDIVARAAGMGCRHITLTDHGTLLGVDDFMDAGAKYGVNPIPGVEAYLEGKQHLILVAKDYEGYQAIAYALRDANRHQVSSDFNKKLVYPIMTPEILESFRGNTHVLATSACIGGPIASILLKAVREQRTLARILEHTEEAAAAYGAAKARYEEAVARIAKLKEERRPYAKYAGKPYGKQAEQKQKKADQLGAKVKALEGKEDRTAKEDAALEKLRVQERDARREAGDCAHLHEDARKVLEVLDRELKQWGEVRKEQKGILDRTAKKAQKHREAAERLKAVEALDPEAAYREARERAEWFRDLFQHFYLELQYHGLEDEAYVMPLLVRIARETGIPLIAANDAHMTDASDAALEARQILRFNYFRRHQELGDADRELYLKSDEELRDALRRAVDPEAVEEAMENLNILGRCKVVFPKEKHYPKVEGGPSFDELLDAAREALVQKGEWDDAHEQCLKREREVIHSMGYVDYHMVVRDFCIMGRSLGVVPKDRLPDMPLRYDQALSWIQKQGYGIGVGVGPGRGSAVGSLVCYLLGITNLDPVKYDLLFERFLNPERVSMPDIDTDIKTSLRPYLIQFIKQKHGEKAVASISTVMRYAGRGALKMATRDRADELYGKLPSKERKIQKSQYSDRLAKVSEFIPEMWDGDLSSLEPEFLAEFSGKEERLIWERAKLIEGKVSSTSVHAGGIVISDNEDLCDYVPLLWREDKQTWATQCDMIRVEQKGMLKMDLLGLNTLDCISDTMNLIWNRYGVAVDLDHLPFEDAIFREIYAAGNTNSVFQFESPGMKQMLREFRPTCFEDLILLVAAYRPGPMQFLDHIIAVKHGKEPETYRTPELEPILSKTYSAIIYQEQVMQIFKDLAGYSLGQADLVRRAMSKKKTEKLQVERKAFIEGDPERGIAGCRAHGIPGEAANALFDEIMDFARYAFNKSHAAAYAMVSYQTAWLKYHYPAEFLCAMFNNKEQEAYGPIVEDCASYGIALLPPDINRSETGFVVEEEGKSIRYGFSGIKGIRESEDLSWILQKRGGRFRFAPFLSMSDFAVRVSRNGKLLHRGFLMTLAKSGVFDCLAPDRTALVQWLETAPEEGILPAVEAQEPQWKQRPTDRRTLRQWESEYLGRLLSEDPLRDYREDGYYGCTPIGELEEGRCTFFGYITDYEEKVSKKGNPMLIVHIQGKGASQDVLFVGDGSARYLGQMEYLEHRVVKVQGTKTEGTVFGNWMERLMPVRKTYGYVCQSQQSYQLLADVLSADWEGGTEILDIFTFWKGPADAPVPEPCPLMVRKRVHPETLARLGLKKNRVKQGS